MNGEVKAELIARIERLIEITKADPYATQKQIIWKVRGQETALDEVKLFLNQFQLKK